MTVQCETHLCSVVQSVQNLCKICARGGGGSAQICIFAQICTIHENTIF